MWKYKKPDAYLTEIERPSAKRFLTATFLLSMSLAFYRTDVAR